MMDRHLVIPAAGMNRDRLYVAGSILEALPALTLETQANKDFRALLLDCDLVAFVSTYEGFGMPIIEANATGKPIVTSNLLSMP